MQPIIAKGGPSVSLDFPYPVIINAGSYVTNEKFIRQAKERGVIINRTESCKLLDDHVSMFSLLNARGISAPQALRLKDVMRGKGFSYFDVQEAFGEEFVYRNAKGSTYVQTLDDLIDWLSQRPPTEGAMYKPLDSFEMVSVGVAPALKNKPKLFIEGIDFPTYEDGLLEMPVRDVRVATRLAPVVFKTALALGLDIGTVTVAYNDDEMRVENVSTLAPYSEALLKTLIKLKRGIV